MKCWISYADNRDRLVNLLAAENQELQDALTAMTPEKTRTHQ